MTQAMPETMRQVYFDSNGGPEVIRLEMAQVPSPGPGQVLIEVAAAGINRPDIIQREGKYPPPPGESAIPGLEVSGRVAARGEGVSSLQTGDEVCALLGSGGYAEYALAFATLCLPIPSGLGLSEAAGIPENYFTVYDNVFTRGQLKAGETFLVHGGSSGIGSTAIQLAKQFGATVIATAGTDDKCHFCKTLGADHAINYRAKDFEAEVKQLTENRGVNVILDMVGGPYIEKNIRCLGMEGRLVQIAFLQGSVAEIDFLPMMLRRMSFTGSTLRSRTLEQKSLVAKALRENIWPLLNEGAVKPIIHATFPLEDARQAHEMMDASHHLGKILLVTGK